MDCLELTEHLRIQLTAELLSRPYAEGGLNLGDPVFYDQVPTPHCTCPMVTCRYLIAVGSCLSWRITTLVSITCSRCTIGRGKLR